MTALPVRDAVSNYEKISRIGEGTYGVVCKLFALRSSGMLIFWLVSRGCGSDRAVTSKAISTCRQSQRPDDWRSCGPQAGQNGA